MKKYVKILLVMFAALIFTSASKAFISKAADESNAPSVSIIKIDYDELTMIIKLNEKDSKLFISTDKKFAKWEEVLGTVKDGCITMDISWINKKKDVTIGFKGDYSTTVTKVTLPKSDKNFKVTFDFTVNQLKLTGVPEGVNTLYWKKKTGDVWKSVTIKDSAVSLNDEIESFLTKGATLLFRTDQVIGTSATDVGKRPANECTLKIAKKAAGPKIALNSSKLSIPFKKTMEYRIIADTEGEWTSVTTDKNYNLSDIVPDVLYTKEGETAKEGSINIEVRLKATAKKSASNITEIKIPYQKPTPYQNIVFAQVGSNKATLNFEDYATIDDKKVSFDLPASDNVFQYCIVKSVNGKAEIDYNKAVWKDIKSSSEISISSKDAPENSKIYLRKAATEDNIPTAPYIISVGKYPEPASLKETVSITKTQGVALVAQPVNVLLPEGNNDVKIESIKFADKAVDISEPTYTDIDGRKMVTVNITSTKLVEMTSENIGKVLKGVITLSNGDKLEKTDDGKNVIELYIFKAAEASSVSLTKYKGVNVSDDVKFKLTLNNDKVGSKQKNPEGINISSITINSQPFNSDEYDYNKNTGEIVIKAAALNRVLDNAIIGSSTYANYDKKFNFKIKLDNEEEIETIGDGVVIKAAAEVTSTNNSISFSRSAYKKEMENVTGGAVSANSAFQNPTVEITIDLGVISKGGNYEVSSAVIGGMNVMSSSTVSNAGVCKIVISLDSVVKAIGNANRGTVVFTLISVDASGAEQSRIIVDTGFSVSLTE